jgi:hypothetical protein
MRDDAIGVHAMDDRPGTDRRLVILGPIWIQKNIGASFRGVVLLLLESIYTMDYSGV